MQGSGRGRSVAPPLTRDRGGPFQFQHRGRGSIVLETVDRPTAYGLQLQPKLML